MCRVRHINQKNKWKMGQSWKQACLMVMSALSFKIKHWTLRITTDEIVWSVQKCLNYLWVVSVHSWGEEGLLGDLVGRSVDQGVADGGCASAKKQIFTQLLLENLAFKLIEIKLAKILWIKGRIIKSTEKWIKKTQSHNWKADEFFPTRINISLENQNIEIDVIL